MAPSFDAIILAGGLGTRISKVVSNRPKAMVDIGGRPFLEFLLERIARQGITRVILATGHLHEFIEAHFGSRWGGAEISYSLEDRPLGTGGALRKALSMTSREEVFVFNGDTFFDADLAALSRFHRSNSADVTIALKAMRACERYGTVDLKDGRIMGFREKKKTAAGLINGGIYLINRRAITGLPLPEKFSLEADFLEKMVNEIRIGGFVQDGYFIDIGVPEDLNRARQELPRL